MPKGDKNFAGAVVIGGDNLPSPVGIGLTELQYWRIYSYLYSKNKMGVTGLIFEPHPPNFENLYKFLRCSNDFLIPLLVSDFQISVWECSVHVCSCPWPSLGKGLQWCRNQGGQMGQRGHCPPPIFGSSVNPIPTGEGRLSPPITTAPAKFLSPFGITLGLQY
jgi:hypothetical protein